MRLALKSTLIMAMAAMPLNIIFVGVSLGFQWDVGHVNSINFVPSEAATALEVDISEEVERSSAARTKVRDNLDSLSRVTGEMQEPDPSGES